MHTEETIELNRKISSMTEKQMRERFQEFWTMFFKNIKLGVFERIEYNMIVNTLFPDY